MDMESWKYYRCHIFDRVSQLSLPMSHIWHSLSTVTSDVTYLTQSLNCHFRCLIFDTVSRLSLPMPHIWHSLSTVTSDATYLIQSLNCHFRCHIFDTVSQLSLPTSHFDTVFQLSQYTSLPVANLCFRFKDSVLRSRRLDTFQLVFHGFLNFIEGNVGTIGHVHLGYGSLGRNTILLNCRNRSSNTWIQIAQDTVQWLESAEGVMNPEWAATVRT